MRTKTVRTSVRRWLLPPSARAPETHLRLAASRTTTMRATLRKGPGHPRVPSTRTRGSRWRTSPTRIWRHIAFGGVDGSARLRGSSAKRAVSWAWHCLYAPLRYSRPALALVFSAPAWCTGLLARCWRNLAFERVPAVSWQRGSAGSAASSCSHPALHYLIALDGTAPRARGESHPLQRGARGARANQKKAWCVKIGWRRCHCAVCAKEKPPVSVLAAY